MDAQPVLRFFHRAVARRHRHSDPIQFVLGGLYHVPVPTEEKTGGGDRAALVAVDKWMVPDY